VLLWRQGRFEGRGRRPDQTRNRHRGNSGQAAEGAGEQGERRNNFRGKQGQGGKDGGKRFHKGQPGDARHENREARKGGKGHHPNRDGGKHHERQERPVKIDPDSPFAKLAALKEQLKK
jgi:ATP-dependent RNA helicase SUPV3L1/SUV3